MAACTCIATVVATVVLTVLAIDHTGLFSCSAIAVVAAVV
jgi:hypothetical protein